MDARGAPGPRQDRADIWDYLFARDESAAAWIDGLFSEAAAQLSEFPMLGHEGEVAGTRELTPHSSYRLIYEIYGDTIWILTLVHTGRQWPPLCD